MSRTLLYAALGAVGLGIAFVVYRKATKPAKPKSICDALSGDAKTACEVASGLSGLLDVFDGATDAEWGQRNDENAKLNGGVDIKLTAELRERMWTQNRTGDPHTQYIDPLFAPTVTAIRYKNGCVPVNGSPGWAKCAQGTHDMTKDDPDGGAVEMAGVRPSDGAHDPFTGWVKYGGEKRRDEFMTGGDYDVATQDIGGGYSYVAGKKVGPCKNGVVVSRDHRTGHEGDVSGTCATDPSTGPVKTPGDPTSSTAIDPCKSGPNPPPGFTWDVDHWRRLRAGESAKPAPCGPVVKQPPRWTLDFDLSTVGIH